MWTNLMQIAILPSTKSSSLLFHLQIRHDVFQTLFPTWDAYGMEAEHHGVMILGAFKKCLV